MVLFIYLFSVFLLCLALNDMYLVYSMFFDIKAGSLFLRFLIDEKQSELALLEGKTWISLDFMEKLARCIKKMAGEEEMVLLSFLDFFYEK